MRLFEDERYLRLAEESKEAYAAADPFPHAVLDNFLTPSVCDQLLDEFPSPDRIEWLRFSKHHSKKLATRGHKQFGPFTTQMLHELNSADFLQFLETLTGITGLIADPYFEGGGLHQIERGGYLKMHVDFNYHKRLRLDRRLNVIVYLNKDWRDEYNGHLELWDRTMSRQVQKILPIYNRCVVFSTTDWSFHGHPEKLACPEGMTRRSLALYYYTNGRPEEEGRTAHETLWRERPQASNSWRQTCARAFTGAADILEGPGKLIRRVATRLSA